MGMRGPKSGAALASPTIADLRGDARPEPPADLTEEQAAEWEAVVARLPADWFPRESHGLLAQYCRHVCTARRLARMLAEVEAAPELNIRIMTGGALAPTCSRAYFRARKQQTRDDRHCSER
jgi:hypothetical protein